MNQTQFMIKGIGQLFKESWKIYRTKIQIFLGIMAVPAALILLGTFVPLVGKEPIKAFAIAAILLLTAIFLGLLSTLALLYAIRDNLSLKASCNRSFQKIRSFLWVYFLMFCLSKVWIFLGGFTIVIIVLFGWFLNVIFGGFIMFSPEANFLTKELIILLGLALLSIFFGIIFFINLSLTIYTLVSEEKRGMKALFRSKQLVAGKFWSVLWRFLIFGLVIAAVIFLPLFILTIAGVNLLIIDFVGYLLLWLILPFALIYGYLIYKDLVEIKAEVPYQEPTKKKKAGYILRGGVGLAFTLLLVILLANFIYRADDEPLLPDNDLWLSAVEVPKQKNAIHYLIRSGEKIYLPEEKCLFEIFDKVQDADFIEKFIEGNQQAFYFFEKALELPYFQHPQFQDPEVVSAYPPPFFPSLGDFRAIANLNSIKAIYLFNQGREKEAFEQAIKIIKMGQMLQDAPRSDLITCLVAMAIKEIGLYRLRAMLPNTNLSSEILIDYANKLGRFKLNEEGLKNALKMEYIMWINILRIYEPPRLRSSFLYKPNQIRRIVAEFYRSLLQNVHKNYAEMQFIRPTPLSLKDFLLTENLAAEMFLVEVLAGKERVLIFRAREDFSVGGTQLLMALRAYQIETCRLPLSLEELMPQYILALPLDPFDGELIRFSAEKRRLWSVGEGLIDFGGCEHETWRENPTFKIRF